MRIVVACLVSAVLLSVPIGRTQGWTHRRLLEARVCDHPLLLRGHAPPHTGYIDAWVNHRRLVGWRRGATSFLFGNSTLVQAPDMAHGLLVIRAVRTIPVCAQLRIVLTW